MKLLKKIMSMVVVCAILVTLTIPVKASDVTEVSLDKKEVTIYAGKTTTLKLTGASGKIKWTSSKPSIASVNNKGKVNAKKSGKTTITAKYKGQSYQCKITVKKVALNKKKVTLYSGKSTIIKLNGSKIKSIKSSKKSIVTVNKSGKIVAKKAGTATITIISVKGKKYTCKVTVKPYLSNTKLYLTKGETAVLTLKGATVKSFESTKPSVATVDKDGRITAVKDGTAIIKVRDINGKNYTCQVKVETPYLNATSLNLKEGEQASLKLQGTVQKVSWLSSDPKVVEINNGGTVTAKSQGTATVTAKVENGKTYECVITVEKN